MSEERKKIMILVATYYPLQDGVQVVTQYIAEGLAQKHEVLVVTSMQSGLERRSELKDIGLSGILIQCNSWGRRKRYESGLWIIIRIY